MNYFKLMSLSVLLFTAVGWGIGHMASQALVIEHPDARLVAYFAPIGVGAAIGLFVGVMSAAMTLFSGKDKTE